MSHRLVFTAQARADLEAITRFLAERSGESGTAAAFALDLIGKCRQIAASRFPAGRLRPELGTGIRTLAYRDYILVFTYEAQDLVIARVLHGRRDFPSLFKD